MLSSKALQCAFAAVIGLTICGTAHAEDWKVQGHLVGLQSAKLIKSRKAMFILSANLAARSSTTKARIAYLIRPGSNVPRSMTSI